MSDRSDVPVFHASFIRRVLRSAVSYVPSRSLFSLRELSDLKRRVQRRPHEPEFAVLRHFNWSRPVVVDVGANRGQAIRSFQLVLSDPRIVCVEPNPVLAAELKKRFPSITLHNAALGEEPGELILHIPRYGHTFHDTRASLHHHVAAEFLSRRFFVPFRPTRAKVEVVAVEVIQLDELDVKPDVVKIDVEGAEELVIAGGLATIASTHPVLIIEMPSDRLVSSLAELGYQDLSVSLRSGRTSLHRGRSHRSHNALFLTSEHLAELDAAGFTIG